MPVKSSKTVVINGTNMQGTPPFLARTHLIAIYPEETDKVLTWFKSKH
jgi:hypothetical protein